MASNTEELVRQFVEDVTAAIDAEANARAAMAVEQALGGGDGRGSAARRAPARRAGPGVSRARRLQGQYLGRLRSLKGRNRARVRAVAKKDGVAKALQLANSILRR